MSAQAALAVAQTRLVHLENARLQTYQSLDQQDTRYFAHHLRGYIDGLTEQFPRASNAIGDGIHVWLQSELEAQPSPSQSTSDASPLETYLTAMKVIDWKVLLFVEVHYPDTPTLAFHEGYRAGIDSDLRCSRADRLVVKQRYDWLRVKFRNVQIDAAIGDLTVAEVNRTLDALYQQGIHSPQHQLQF